MAPIIQVHDLRKRYWLGEHRVAYSTLREDIVKVLRAPLWRRQQTREALWALRGVSFEVSAGEVVGIIGRNGAGKSTVLKILSRITSPTSGSAELFGRVGSLLEVGMGFHLELTGRENIYISGAILGMNRREIRQKFDEIVAFAEAERFLDTQVKHYSSGMQTKLAFSVAAHLDPEILLVDEVLAVGDAAFQKKCLNKMKDVAQGGRTVLFVSHNSATIEALCSRCLWLRDGTLEADGEPLDLLRKYLMHDTGEEVAQISLADHPRRTPGSEKIMRHVTLLSEFQVPTVTVRIGDRIGIKVGFRRDSGPFKPVLGVALRTVTGASLFGVNNRFIPAPSMPESATHGAIVVWIDSLPLMPGVYFIDLYCGNEYRDMDIVREALRFNVEAADVFGTGQLCPAIGGPICWGGKYEFEASDVSSAANSTGNPVAIDK